VTKTTDGAVPIGTLPPVGEIPASMLAQVIRQDRLGDPATAFQIEEIPTPEPGPGEVLVGVMAAGINFNNVWAARGVPIDVIAVRQRGGDPHDFHVGGSDAAGVIYAVGAGVDSVAVGDEVVLHHGSWDASDPWVVAGKDPMLAPSSRIWGYETNFGAFGQFSIAQAHQCMPKAPHLSWEDAAAAQLVGTTAYRMLFGWSGNEIREGDVVLIWGGSGGLGTQAIQLVRHGGGIPIAVVSSVEKGRFCESLGAAGWIDRSEFDHWGIPPHWDDEAGQKAWTGQARAFGKKIWDVVGERCSPAIVVEHPGEETVPTSIFVCETGGMVVICAGTSGYSAMVDLRYHWTRQKRLQGSHGTNDEQAAAWNNLVHQKEIDPVLGAVFPFEKIPEAHVAMGDGVSAFGNTAVLVGAAERGLGKST
jgi:crotonyl-CoA carboxylase/reductase